MRDVQPGAPGVERFDPEETLDHEGRAERFVGRVVARRYRIEAPIARGGMGAVFRARQVALNRRVAIKLLSPRTTEDPEDPAFLQRFLREAAALGQLHHPNVVRVHDCGRWQGMPYLVMEYVDGRPLSALMRSGPVPPIRMIGIALQILGALQEAHALGLMHRDLKPANVLLTRRAGALDVVKVVDFGLAKAMWADDQEVTQAGQVVGTPMYMAPEQIRDQACDGRADLYAVGALLYRGLTGATPFELADVMTVMRAALRENPRPFAVVAPHLDLPPVLETVVRRAMSRHPDDRYATAADMAVALEEVLADLQEGADEPTRETMAGDGPVVEGVLPTPQAVSVAAAPRPSRWSRLADRIGGEARALSDGLGDQVADRLEDVPVWALAAGIGWVLSAAALAASLTTLLPG